MEFYATDTRQVKTDTVCSDALTLCLCVVFFHSSVCSTSWIPTRLLIMKKNNSDKKKFFRARLRISQSARTNIVNAPIKKTSRPSVATHKNWMDPASRLKNDYCSFARRTKWKQKPKANNRRWGSKTFYCHNHRTGFWECTISKKKKKKRLLKKKKKKVFIESTVEPG